MHFYITAKPLNQSGTPLLLGPVLFGIKENLDLSCYVPRPGEASHSRLFDEIKAEQSHLTESELVHEMSKNQYEAGIFKAEYPFTSEYLSLPIRLLIIREKCYHLDILHKPTKESPKMLGNKLAARSAVPRVRMNKYSFEDFYRMANANSIVMATDLKSLRSKNLGIYEIAYSRREATIFSRKNDTRPRPHL